LKKKNQKNQEEESQNLEENNDLSELSSLFGPEFECRTLSLYGEVSEERCKTISSGLYFLRDSADSPSESEETESVPSIEMLISTEGGSVSDMFAVYDCMIDVQKDCDIHTFGIGKVMSEGILLLAAGTKGKRKIGRNCRLMLHAVSGGHFGSLKELEVDIQEVRWYQKQFTKALALETKISEQKIRAIFRKKTDTYFDAEKAIEWGIADEIV